MPVANSRQDNSLRDCRQFSPLANHFLICLWTFRQTICHDLFTRHGRQSNRSLQLETLMSNARQEAIKAIAITKHKLDKSISRQPI